MAEQRCSECGGTNPEDAAFCMKCGTLFKAPQQQEYVVEQQAQAHNKPPPAVSHTHPPAPVQHAHTHAGQQQMHCPYCRGIITAGAIKCMHCGEFIRGGAAGPANMHVHETHQHIHHVRPRPQKSKIAAGVLALLLGGLGVHHFYLGNIGLGILYLLFCWTYIPAIAGFIEGIVYLCTSDENWKYA